MHPGIITSVGAMVYLLVILVVVRQHLIGSQVLTRNAGYTANKETANKQKQKTKMELILSTACFVEQLNFTSSK